MGLQIRVRHALGERVIELPDRTVDEPLVVGRAATAEVQVPSVTVAPKHCVLFIHEGHWAVQDLGAGSGTFVNHEPVNGARFLQIGDVISVGGDGNAPTIEVDPAAAAEGRTGFAGTGLPQAAAPYGAYAMPAATMAPMSQPAYGYAAPAAVMHQTQYAAPAPVMPVAEAPAEEFPAYSPSIGYASRRRRKKSSSGPIILVIGGTLALAGGVIAFAVYNNNRNAQVLAQNEAAKQKAAADKAAAEKALQEAEAKARSKELFVDSSDPIRMPPRSPRANVAKPSTPANPPSTPAVATNNPPSTPATPPVTTTTPPAAPKTPGAEEGMDPIRKPATPAPGGTEEGMDPIKKPAKPAGSGTEEGMDPIKKPSTPAAPPAAPKKDPETLDPQAAASWEAMKELSEQGGKESFAVLRFEDYKRMSPGAHDAEIDQFIDKKMDRIWWERVAQLLKKIDKINTDSVKIREELLDENNPDEKKKKIDAYKKMESEKSASVKTLRDQMKYSGDVVPNLTDESSLTQLAGQRDKGAYELWKKITISYIKSNQGRLPWANDL